MVLDHAPTLSHSIAFPTYYLGADLSLSEVPTHSEHVRFLRKATDLAYSIIESPKSRGAMQKLLQDMAVGWNESKKPHAYHNHSPTLAAEQADAVAHFLDRLRRSPPVIQIGDDPNLNGMPCIAETVREDRTEIVPMWKVDPRGELTIIVNLKV